MIEQKGLYRVEFQPEDEEFQRMRERLNHFQIGLRRGAGNSKLFYGYKGSHTETYTLRFDEIAQQWICNPISGTPEEANRIRRIAIGEIQP
jgi:hypothetical protein